jgi:hypothetical protein
MLSPKIITDLEVARLLEKEFNASWLPEYSKCSIFTDCALVVVDMDRHFSPGSLGVTTEEIEKQMGFVVKTAFYIHSSIVYSGSADMAERVSDFLSSVYGAKCYEEQSE